ncbi:MAG TPA: preprotein translocase subunit SecG [Longimicrobiales bacterium]|nr:preprotein translocase subunit SecG [Longimicrobiales bacterium]
MFGILLFVLILDGLFLSVIILLQSGKGGGLAAMGGSGTAPTDGILGGRQATNLLTRATWTSGTVFMVLALVLSIMSSRASSAPSSVIRPNAPVNTQPAPVLPGLGDEGAATGGDTGGDTGGAEPPPAGDPGTGNDGN